MSTRSGKRIHSSFHESEVTADTEAFDKTERKTRSKRQKENCDDAVSTTNKSRKRNNYVSYPTDDEVASESYASNEKGGQEPKGLRKNTLKEQDFNVANNKVLEPVPDAKKILRQTRRTRKFSENNTEPVLEENENATVLVVNTETGKPKGKKNKKKKVKNQPEANQSVEKTVSKKQSKKKKKKSKQNNSDIKNGSLKSDMSMESFHSAAGSPAHNDGNAEKPNNSLEKSLKEISESDRDAESDNVALTSENKHQKKKRKSSIKNDALKNYDISTNDNIVDDSKMNHSIGVKNSSECLPEILDKNTNKKRKLSIKNDVDSPKHVNATSRMSISKNSIVPENINTTFEKSSKRKSLTSNSSIVNSLNSTFEKNKERTESVNTTFEKDDIGKRKSLRISEAPKSLNTTFERSVNGEFLSLNTTFEKHSPTKNKTLKQSDKKESGGLNTTFEKTNRNGSDVVNTTFEKDDRKKSLRSNLSPTKPLNSTFEKSSDNKSKINTTFDKETELNSTFDKTTNYNITKSKSLDADNLTFDKSNENSRISISDDSQTENIVNTTPLLIESSMDESVSNSETSQKAPELSATPLKREGTFTKDMPEVVNNENLSPRRTSQRLSPSSPGSTPFPFSKGSQKKSVLNVTRSIEKATRRSFSLEAPSRTTKVMFCSPINNPAVVMQQKRKVIKSNLKGSNKSFVFDDNESSSRAAPRKRSYTHNDVDEQRAKRKRLPDDLQLSVDRLSRPRTPSATGKPEPSTPSKKTPTPSKSKSDTKVSRTKLPNFAALHQRRFDKMESLDECQERKAKRARQLLIPSAPVTVLERSSPRGSLVNTEPLKQKDVKKPDTTVAKKAVTPAKKLSTLDTLKPGYTRFGFKMNIDVNPFSIPNKSVVKPKENKPKALLTRQVTLPSLAGTTSTRREVAKQTVMREKSFTLASEKRNEKRKENRSIIKGVRTNRRFDLQMKMRNIN
ncbi:mitotic spindle and nuclear protein [Aphomia sociella]